MTAGRVCPAVLQTLHLSGGSQNGYLEAVTGDNLQAAGALLALADRDGPLELDQVRAGGQEVALPCQPSPRLTTVEGGEVTAAAEVTEPAALTSLTHVAQYLTAHHTLGAQATRQVRGEALSRLQHFRGRS